MTQNEFDIMTFHKGMKAFYFNEEWLIASVDFSERLLGLIKEENLQAYLKGLEQATWVRCESCNLINQPNSITNP